MKDVNTGNEYFVSSIVLQTKLSTDIAMIVEGPMNFYNTGHLPQLLQSVTFNSLVKR